MEDTQYARRFGEALNLVGRRRDLRLPSAVEQAREGLVTAATRSSAPIGPTLPALLDAWFASALRSVSAARSALALLPEAIRHRFLTALVEDPATWDRIVAKHANTVAATCSMSARSGADDFDWVIIDEAGRASPFELLIPLVQGRRIVLIGDHRQLPPTVDEAIWRRSEAGSTQPDIRYETVFQELWNKVPSLCRVRLGTEYRMHERIGEVVSEAFYRGAGEGLRHYWSGARADHRLYARGPHANKPLVWVDLPGRQRRTYENPEEVEAILGLLAGYSAAGAAAGDVAVIVPYAAQRDRLERGAAEAGLAGFAHVYTIDAVQGREWPVVVLGTTRTDGGAGFLTSPHRVNVALSRAQRQLIVLGTWSRLLRSGAPDLVRALELVRRGADV